MSGYATLFHRASASGRRYWAPAGLYTFLVTGEESGGAYFAMEALVTPGGGSTIRHLHRHEAETFYILEGTCTVYLEDAAIDVHAGDFVNIPVGAEHCFHNTSASPVRMILTFTPAGFETLIEECLPVAFDTAQGPPVDMVEIAARYAEAAPRYGMEFVDG
jgi:quercetin dioxygenase-like cupin family protein